MTTPSSIGERLSRELTPTGAASAPELLPLAEVRERVVRQFNAAVTPGAHLSKAKLKSKSLAADRVESELRKALQDRVVDAYVHHPDSRLFRIPACYWGSFHDYRPLNEAGFLTDAAHGKLAFELNGQGVFLDKHKADANWPYQDNLPDDEVMRAMAMEVPATLEGIGAVIKTDEALNWIAFGTPSNADIFKWNDLGDVVVLHADGTPATRESGEAKMVQFRAGVEKAIAGLRDGDLPAYVAKRETMQAVAIPVLYWNLVDGLRGMFLYQGFAGQERHRGLPVLVPKSDVMRFVVKIGLTVSSTSESRSRNAPGKRVDDGASPRLWKPSDLAEYAKTSVSEGLTQTACVDGRLKHWPDEANRPPRNEVRAAYAAAMGDAGKAMPHGRPVGSKTRHQR